MRARVVVWLVVSFTLTVGTGVLGCGGGDPGDPRYLEDGELCDGDVQCLSGHCDSGLCCRSGTCCATANDCPAAFRSDPVCLALGDATECQGDRRIASCESHVCGSTTVTNDSGCQGQVRSCGTYKPVICTNSEVQPVAACATSCDAPADCAADHTCVNHACVPVAGSGQSCTGTGQGNCSSSALKCMNGVCCSATAATCCTSSSQCANGLACSGATSSCFTSCSNESTDRCAAPGTYCKDDACVAKLGVGATCSSPTQCGSGACECFDATCASKKCRSTWCGQCQYATGDATCTGGLGSPAPVGDPNPADGCVGPALSCFAGACKKTGGQACTANVQCGSGVCVGGLCGVPSSYGGPCDDADGAADCSTALTCAGGTCKKTNGQACSAPAECGSGACECADASCASKVCHAGWCGVCEYATSATACAAGLGAVPGAHYQPVIDPAPGSCEGTRSCIAGRCYTRPYERCSTQSECFSGTCVMRDATFGRCAGEAERCVFVSTCANGGTCGFTGCMDDNQYGSCMASDLCCCN